MSALYVVVALVALQRLAELALARRNLRRLLARGGIEHGSRHYPLIVAFHALWLVAPVVLVPSDRAPDWPLLAAYLTLQGLRYWAIASLGDRWTTRIVTIPGESPLRSGPYRFLRHPNYLVVALEIPLLPAAFGAWNVAGVFGVLNLALLALRIRAEDAALDRTRAGR